MVTTSGNCIKMITMHMIGKYLRQLRQAEGLTIRELAKKVDISHNTIAAYERESIMPSLINAYTLAEYFGVPIEYLLKGEKIRSDFNDAELLALFNEIDTLEREDRNIAKKFLKKLVKNRRERESLLEEAE
jgi:transcriptional regulator with XRE-family HTH domain